MKTKRQTPNEIKYIDNRENNMQEVNNMEKNETIDMIVNILNQVDNAEKQYIKDIVQEENVSRPRKNVLEFMGVYIIYEFDEIIYVGMAGKNVTRFIKYRIGDLLYYKPETGETKHPMMKKLIQEDRFENIDEIRKYLLGNGISLKVLKTSTTKETERYEHLLIGIFQPRYNDTYIQS